ncbi:radical SAM protein [candidate division TA06 bacterium]|nr:radical SAM protein [candidate division TA06 bacterium]
MSKVLLFNPPGDKTYLRDSYCSKVSKAAYLTPPIDLLVVSGYLHTKHQITVLDAMAQKLPAGQALDKIRDINPEYIISLFGQASLENDLGFFALLKREMPEVKLLVSGDAGFDDTERLLRSNSFIDAVILDYSSPGWLGYLEGARSGHQDIASINGGAYSAPRSPLKKEYSIGVPRHELFPYKKYRMPFARKLPYAGVVTDFGCPFKCDFCLIGQMPYKLRPVPEVMEELLYLKKLGIKYFSFGDQTFGADRERTEKLLSEMISKRINLPWGCFARADLLTEEILLSMKRAGCELLMMGVESGDQEMLDRYHKKTTIEIIRRAFALCKKHGIRTVATFIIGLPGETETSFQKTMDLALELDPDFASFNVPVAKPLTPLTAEARSRGWVQGGEQDQSSSSNILEGETDGARIGEWRRRAMHKFYLRPGYIFKRLKGISNLTELKINLAEAMTLLKGQS